MLSTHFKGGNTLLHFLYEGHFLAQYRQDFAVS